MNKETRKETIRELDDLIYQAEKLKKEFWYLGEKLYQDKTAEGQAVYGLSQVMAQAVNKVIEVNSNLKKLGADWIKGERRQFIREAGRLRGFLAAPYKSVCRGLVSIPR